MLKAVTFDIYTAVFDTAGSIASTLAVFFQRRGIAEDAQAIARIWRQKHFDFLLLANSLEREPASNRRAIHEAARYALRHIEPAPTEDDLAALVAAWESLTPWPDALEILAAVRKEPVVLGALSNGDEDMLRALLKTLPVSFDCVISTEGSKFKPHPSVYRKAVEMCDTTSDAIVHLAGSVNDAMGSTAAGIETIWTNRTGDAPLDRRFSPAHEVRDLREAFAILKTIQKRVYSNSSK